MPDILSFILPENWIASLTKSLRGLSGKRKQALDRLFRDFGDWKELARCYVEPEAQVGNPADLEAGDSPPMGFGRIPIHKWINQFQEKRFKTRSGHNILFVLAEAGMGKSSLLAMLKLESHRRFLPQGFQLALLKIGPQTLESLRELREHAASTMLLLDGLEHFEGSTQDLLHQVSAFRQAIITCRTHYFPSQTTHGRLQPRVRPGMVQLGGYECNLLYLSPFSREQIDQYLCKAYPNPLGHRLVRKLFRRPDRRRQIDQVVESMGVLARRPFLLAHVESLIDRRFGPGSEYAIYEHLVDRWLAQEVIRLNKAGIPVSVEQLWAACTDLAFRLQKLGLQLVDQATLDQAVLDEQQDLRSAFRAFELVDRLLLSRTPEGQYRFAHQSIQEFLALRAILYDRGEPGVELTPQMLTFLVSAASEEGGPEIPWHRIDPDLKHLATIDLDRFDLLHEGICRAALNDPDPAQRYGALVDILELLPHPTLALIYLDQQRRRTRQGDELYHLELAVELIARSRASHTTTARQLRERFYDHIPPPPDDLFQTAETRDGQVALWRVIPAGTYRLGSPRKQHYWKGERSPYQVRLESSFLLAAIPVNQVQYRAFDPDHISYFQGDERPVESVSWWAAVAFCRWLSQYSETAAARLPTEEEWEIACRAGTTTAYWSGDQEEDLDRVGWYGKNSKDKTHDLGLKPANPWGLYDLHGNVDEWTLSLWRNPAEESLDSVSLEPSQWDPFDLIPTAFVSLNETTTPNDLAALRLRQRVIRGSSYVDEAALTRSAYRNSWRPQMRDEELGFRVLRLLAAPSTPLASNDERAHGELSVGSSPKPSPAPQAPPPGVSSTSRSPASTSAESIPANSTTSPSARTSR